MIHGMALDGGKTDNVTGVPSNTTLVSVANTNGNNGCAFAGTAYTIAADTSTFTTNAFTHTDDGWTSFSIGFKAA